MLRVGFYTSGIVGAGHLARALAIERAFLRARSAVDYRIFYARPPTDLPCDQRIVKLDDSRETLADRTQARETNTARALSEFAPDVLVVDLAWRDLLHLLPLAKAEAWLILRYVHPEFLRGPFNRGFRDELFARVIAIEPILPFPVREHIEPIVIANRDECHPTGALRDRFAVPEGVPITLVAQAGQSGERELLIDAEERRADGHRIVVPELDDPGLFPIAPWLPGADRIVGGAGYNLYWETRWLGLGERTSLQAFRRRVDDQTPRLRGAGNHVMKENGADILVRWMTGGAGSASIS